MSSVPLLESSEEQRKTYLDPVQASWSESDEGHLML